jgi:hypothetical protein
MALVYGDEGPKGKFSGTPVHLWGTGAVMAAWAKHLDARFYLLFMARKGTYAEKAAAAKELLIANRKIAFWEKHPAFDKSAAARELASTKSRWAV